MMRIVQVCPYDMARNGGVQQHIRSLSAELRRRGHEVLIISPGLPARDQDDWHVRMGAMRKISLAGTAFELALADKAELAALMKRFADWQPDIMHYHTMWVPLLPWQIFRRMEVATVATFHDTPPPGLTGNILRTTFKVLSRILLNRIDGAIAVSPAPLGHLRSGRFGIKPVILPPSIDLGSFLACQKPAPGPRHEVLFVGRLEPRKGIATLIAAWELIANGQVARPAGLAMPRLTIAGGGELVESVAAASQRLGAGVLRHLPAPDDAVRMQLLAAASLAVSPAIYGESFGLVLIEALATGTPVVGAANAGYATVLTGAGADLLVPPGDALALAGKIVELLADDRKRQALGEWGRAHARQFDVAILAPDFEAVYGTAMARHRRS